MECVVVSRESPTRLSVAKPGGPKSFVNGAARRLDRAAGDGLVKFVVESDMTRPLLVVVSEQDAASVAVLDSLPEHTDPIAVRKVLDGATPPKQLESIEGSINVDGSVVTVQTLDRRVDFVVGSEVLPVVQDVSATEDGADVHLLLPDETRLRLAIRSDDVDASQKAIAVIRATHRDDAAELASKRVKVRWQYKVVKNLSANKLEETLNGYGKAGWELVSMTGLDGVVSLTGNKLYAVLKKQL